MTTGLQVPPMSSETKRPPSEADGAGRWLSSFRIYLMISAAGHLTWEFAHMPLYTLYETGTRREILFAGLHCTAGDLLIATAVLVLALLVFGEADWPAAGAGRVFAAALVMGIGYTIISEWLNVTVRGAWAYSAWMPVVPIVGTGLSPLLQWIVVPGLAFATAVRWWKRLPGHFGT